MAIHALRRRALLEEALDLLFEQYDLPFDNARLGSPKIVTERVAMNDLVRVVCSKLNAEDAALLSDDALRMIFNGGNVHQEGNDMNVLNPDFLEMG